MEIILSSRFIELASIVLSAILLGMLIWFRRQKDHETFIKNTDGAEKTIKKSPALILNKAFYKIAALIVVTSIFMVLMLEKIFDSAALAAIIGSSLGMILSSLDEKDGS